DKERANFLVARPSCNDDTRLHGSAAAIDKLLNAVVFADVEFPGVAGRVTAFIGILHWDHLGRAAAHRQFVHTLIGDASASVPVSMQGKQKPIVIVIETRIDIILHIVRLAAELGAQVRSLDRLAVFILPLIGDLIRLRLPNPRTGDIHSGELCVPGIADRFNLPKRIDTISLGNLFNNWRTALSPGGCSEEQHSDSYATDHPYVARIYHGF